MSNSSADMHPELAVEWSERNLPLTPDNIRIKQNSLVDRNLRSRVGSYG